MRMDRTTRRKSTQKKKNPLSLPQKKRKGNYPTCTPLESPPYPPPENDGWETESLPRLVTPDEDQDTLITQGQNSPGVPANQDADRDFFHDSERQLVVQQKFGNEIAQAPWNPLADSDDPLSKLGDMVNKATPVYEGFWRDNDSDILSRLDAASKKLKEKRGSAQEEAHDEPSPNEQDELDTEDPHPSNPESPSSQLMESTQNDLRDNLKDAISSIPVEPMTPQTGPPKVIPPMPYSKHDVMVPPPLGIPANFSIKLKSVAKMRTGPPPQKTKMLIDLVTRPKLLIKKLTPDEIQEMSLPPAETKIP